MVPKWEKHKYTSGINILLFVFTVEYNTAMKINVSSQQSLHSYMDEY